MARYPVFSPRHILWPGATYIFPLRIEELQIEILAA